MKLAAMHDRGSVWRHHMPSDGGGILHIESCQPIGYRARRKITIDLAEPLLDISLDLGDPCDFEDDTLVYFLLLDIRNRTQGLSRSNRNSPFPLRLVGTEVRERRFYHAIPCLRPVPRVVLSDPITKEEAYSDQIDFAIANPEYRRPK